MDSYLELATNVLREARRPLSARQILNSAYQLSIVPQNLYGKTQHKTLHARIAEDIRQERVRSAFVRTQPGRFFLRTFLNDPSIPARYKREYPAPLRADQLKKFTVACFRSSDTKTTITFGSLLDKIALDSVPVLTKQLSEVQSNQAYIFLRTFVITAQAQHIVVRRTGRVGTDALGSKASLGSLGFVKYGDLTMFAEDSYDFTEALLRTVSEQLDLAPGDIGLIRERHLLRPIGLLAAPKSINENSIAAIAVCRCPEECNPIARYKGGGVLYWHPVNAQFNDPDVLDAWSQEILRLRVLEHTLS
jgi:hypothetical protein